MKKLLACLAIVAFITTSAAPLPVQAASYGKHKSAKSHSSSKRAKTVHVRGHYTKKGTYVAAHKRAAPTR